MIGYLVVSLLSALLGSLLPWWPVRYFTPDLLVAKLNRNHFRGLEAYLDEEERPSLPGRAFWEQSRGVLGILDRIRQMWLLVRILQVEVHAGRVPPQEAREVWQEAVLQIWFSLWAVLEAALCRAWPRLPHVYGLFALRCHRNLTGLIFTICGKEGAPLCILSLCELL